MMQKQQLLQTIYEAMESVTQYQCPPNQIRQYLSAITKFDEFERWLAEKYNNDEEIPISALKRMQQDAENILKNLGI